MKNILYCVIEVQTHFGMPRGAKMSLDLNEATYNVSRSNSYTNSKHAPMIWKVLYAKKPTPDQKSRQIKG